VIVALCDAPRVITSWSFGGPPGGKSYPGTKSYVDPLRPMAGQLVRIEVVPDATACRAALNIRRALADAQWKVQTQLTFVDALADGVSVQPSVPTIPAAKDEILNLSRYWHASELGEELRLREIDRGPPLLASLVGSNSIRDRLAGYAGPNSVI
jgi:hypothetical protein